MIRRLALLMSLAASAACAQVVPSLSTLPMASSVSQSDRVICNQGATSIATRRCTVASILGTLTAAQVQAALPVVTRGYVPPGGTVHGIDLGWNGVNLIASIDGGNGIVPLMAASPTGVTTGTFGGATSIPVLSVNQFGQITSIGTVAATGGGGGGGTATTDASQLTAGTLPNARLASNSVASVLGYTPLSPANNLSDIGAPATARTNLGLGSAATQPSSAFDAAGAAASAANAASNAASITVGTLNAARLPTFTGDVVNSSGGAMTLANSGVTAGTYGSATTVPVPTFDAKGRATGVTTATITPAGIGAAPLANANTWPSQQTFNAGAMLISGAPVMYHSSVIGQGAPVYSGMDITYNSLNPSNGTRNFYVNVQGTLNESGSTAGDSVGIYSAQNISAFGGGQAAPANFLGNMLSGSGSYLYTGLEIDNNNYNKNMDCFTGGNTGAVNCAVGLRVTGVSNFLMGNGIEITGRIGSSSPMWYNGLIIGGSQTNGIWVYDNSSSGLLFTGSHSQELDLQGTGGYAIRVRPGGGSDVFNVDQNGLTNTGALYANAVRLDGAQGANGGGSFTASSGQHIAVNVTVTGAALGDFALCSMSVSPNGLTLSAQVTAANTVECDVDNRTAGSITIGSTFTYRARVIHF